MAGDGKRRTIRLGKVSQKMAEGVKRRVEELNVAKITDSPIDRDTAQWLTQIDDTLAERLAKVDLIPKRRLMNCGEQLTQSFKSLAPKPRSGHRRTHKPTWLLFCDRLRRHL